MYTAFDFINKDIPSKYMRFGWKIEIKKPNGFCSYTYIILKYTMLNFDWNSIEWLGDEAMNMFLSCNSLNTMKKRSNDAIKKYKKLYYSALSINDLKLNIETANLKIDLDKLINKAIKKKSEKTKQKIKEKEKINHETVYN